jgi:hypothetical protein
MRSSAIWMRKGASLKAARVADRPPGRDCSRGRQSTPGNGRTSLAPPASDTVSRQCPAAASAARPRAVPAPSPGLPASARVSLPGRAAGRGIGAAPAPRPTGRLPAGRTARLVASVPSKETRDRERGVRNGSHRSAYRVRRSALYVNHTAMIHSLFPSAARGAQNAKRKSGLSPRAAIDVPRFQVGWGRLDQNPGPPAE